MSSPSTAFESSRDVTARLAGTELLERTLGPEGKSTWSREQRWAAVTYIKYLVYEDISWPILEVEPTLKIAWLRSTDIDLIDECVSQAKLTLELEEMLS